MGFQSGLKLLISSLNNYENQVRLIIPVLHMRRQTPNDFPALYTPSLPVKVRILSLRQQFSFLEK